MILVRQVEQPAQVGLGLLEDAVEHRRPMADLEHRHADVRQRQQIAARLLEDRFRQHGRSRAEIEYAIYKGGRHHKLAWTAGDRAPPAHAHSRCVNRPSRSFGSNQVDLGGMISPASEIASSSSTVTAAIEKATAA